MISLKTGHDQAMIKVRVREMVREEERLEQDKQEEKDKEEYTDIYIG